jgi:hypothetical protein
MKTFKEDKLAAENAAQYEANLVTYKNWLVQHRQVADCIANRKMFEGYMDWTDHLSPADFDLALGNLTSRLQLATQRVPTEEETKAELINGICDLLRSPNSDGRGGRYSEVALANERKRLQTFSKEQLIARRDEIVEKQRLQKLSAGQIRQELQASRPAPQVKVLPAEYTKKRIHAMPPHEIKQLIRYYTASVVNDRIFGRN